MESSHLQMATPKKQIIKNPVPVKPLQSKGPFHFIGTKFTIIFILSVIGLCFLLYGNTIPNEFSLDDEFVLHNDTIVAKGISGIPELFKTRYAWDQKGGYGYRPIVKASFSIEYSLFNDSPHWGHLINILIYAFICIFLFYFFRKLLYNKLGDYFLLTALALFITHPIHSEVVASLKNRDEMMVFLFGFYCCYALLKWFESDKVLPRVLWGISGCISLGLATLCKPDALIFIAITALILYFFTSKGIQGAISSFLLLVLPIIRGYRFIHKNILPHSDYHRTFTYIENPLVGVHWFHKFTLAFSTVWFYISKMIFPKDLVSYYGYNAFDAFPKWTDFSVLAGILISVFFLYLIIKNIRKKTALLFMLLLFVGTLFPYTDLAEVGVGIVAERFMFIPSVSFIFLITYLLYYILKIPVDKKPFGQPATYLYAFTIGVCVIFSARIWARNPDWKTHQSLYLHDSKVAPNSAKLQSLLGATYVADAQKLQASEPQQREAIDSFYLKGLEGYQKSVDIYPEYGTSWNNLGMIEFTLYANTSKAISDFEKALNVDSEYTEAWFNMGTCYEALAGKVADTLHAYQRDSTSLVEKNYFGNNTKESLDKMMAACKNRIEHDRAISEKSYLQTIKLKPTYYIAYIYISRLYTSEGKYHKILELDSNALKNGYQSDPIYVTLGNAYILLNDTANAVLNYEKSIRFYNRNYYISGFLQNYYYKKGDMEKSRYYKQLYNDAVNLKTGQTP